jgi:hypothetical protein
MLRLNLRRNHMNTMTLAGALALAAANLATGQEIQWTRRVDNGSTNHKAEVAVAVNRLGGDVIVSWMHYVTTGSFAQVEVHYNVSVDGQSFREDAGRIPVPPGSPVTGGDPMASFSVDGVGWVGYLSSGVAFYTVRFWVARKNPGEAFAQVAKEALFGVPGEFSVDKGVLAAGPPTGGGQDLLGITFTRRPVGGEHRLRGSASADLGETWGAHVPVGADPEGNRGGPNAMRILRHVPSGLVGRRVVAYYKALPTDEEFSVAATWSPDGSLWFDSVAPEHATVPCPAPCPEPQTTELIEWFKNSHLTGFRIAPFVLNTPSLASDPRDERTMYMAFVGRRPNSSRLDVFIARSLDAGANFSRDESDPTQPLGSQVLRLRHWGEDDPANPDDISHWFYPMITVDQWGGVHVFFYTAWRNAQNIWKYRVRYAYINDFRTHPQPSISFRDVTPEFDLERAPAMYFRNDRRFIGDYFMADSRGWCDVYAGYASWHAPDGAAGIYVTKVNICIDADMNGDRVLDAADLELFVSAFAAGDPRADLDRDGQLTTADCDRFWQSFNCACNP